MVDGTRNNQLGTKKRNPSNRNKLNQGRLVEGSPNDQEEEIGVKPIFIDKHSKKDENRVDWLKEHQTTRKDEPSKK